MKIAIIGAGGYVFPLRLTGDVLSFPELRDCTISLMDIYLDRAERTAAAARELVDHYGFATQIEATDDRRAALDGADFVIITFYIGDDETRRIDKEIPLKYGIDQTVGDTIGPGGVFSFMRAAPVYESIVEDIMDVCPDAQVINYANPMAMNCWFMSELGVTPVGLCHSVQNTSHMLAGQIDVPYEDIHFTVAGINHQAWFLDFRRGNEDLYPRIRQVMGERFGQAHRVRNLAPDSGDHSVQQGSTTYEGAQERVRTSIMEAFGYFHTESSHHASEYMPYFRKNPDMVHEYIPERWPRPHGERDVAGRTRELLAQFKEELKPSSEYGAFIMHSMVTDQPRVIYGNVPNTGLIPNLPDRCTVEVACLVDRNGIQPTAPGPLPPQCAAVNRTSVNVQDLAVQAALTGDREHIYHAIALDPLTSAMLTLEQIRQMVDEMIEAEREWLAI
ncbi:MAG: alpha-galactosidase [Sphaerobacteraceae bacterium]|nr:MAG: alpha-galactosidase [Sphaerobacteraceae bacterium]